MHGSPAYAIASTVTGTRESTFHSYESMEVVVDCAEQKQRLITIINAAFVRGS